MFGFFARRIDLQELCQLPTDVLVLIGCIPRLDLLVCKALLSFQDGD